MYFYAALAAADVFGIAILSESLSEIGAFLPVIFSATIILVIFGADALEDIVASVDASRLTTLAGIGVKLFVHYITITIALDTIGFSTAVLTALFMAQ